VPIRSAALSALLLATICSFHTARAAGTELLSIQGLSIEANELITEFQIETWGVQILAVCHIPPSWRVTAGNFVNPEGILSGEAGTVQASLRQSDLDELNSLVLVRLDQYQADPRGDPGGEYHPATFAGSIRMQTVGLNPAEREVQLVPANFVRQSAARCPDQAY
jgi:hypothetical protein